MPPQSSQPTTLFVRNLAPHTTKADLDAHFSTVGPLRRALIVTDNDSGLCKGFGFVHYALPDDAAVAFSQLNGSFIRGRKVSLDAARSRQRGVKDGDGGLLVKEGKGKETRRGAGAKGAVGMRTVIVKRTNGDMVDENEVKKRVGDVGRLLIAGGGKELRCTFDTWAEAGKGAAKLHRDGMEAWIEALAGGKKTRLIVRNLPFKCNVSEVRKTFGEVAPVREVHLEPARMKEGEKEDRGQRANEENDESIVHCAGFGFIEYFLVADAKFAMSKMNGTKIGGRVVAVDMALGKSHYLKRIEGDQDEQDKQNEDTVGGAEREENDNDGESVVSNGTDSDALDGEEENGQDDAEDVDVRLRSLDTKHGPEKKLPESTTEEMARTVFVRNLLFETSASELWKAMSEEFGRVEQSVLVKHPVTKRPRGTAFVRFARQEDADEAVARCGEGDTSKTRSVSLSTRTNSFSLQGRPLLVSKAVDRTKAKDLEAAAKRTGKKEDPRNLRLAWIGQVKAGTAEAKGLSDQDLARLAKSEHEKRNKLAQNPNAFISETRLSVRNIPKEVDDKVLKQLFLVAVEKELKKEGEKGKKKEAQQKAEANRKKEGYKRDRKDNEIAGVRITYCKIIQDEERNGRSKGYGFIEFERHEHALAALNAVNNNARAIEILIAAKPKVLKIDEHRERLMRKQWGDGRRLQVEFSVEDRRKVEIIKRIKEKGKKLSEENKKRKLEEGAEEKSKERKKRKKNMKDKSKKVEEGEENELNATGKVRTISKSERKSVLKRKRAEESNEKGQAKAKRQRKEGSSRLDGNKRELNEARRGKTVKRQSATEEKELDKQRDLKQKRQKRKEKKKEAVKEERFESLVAAYKRKLESKGLQNGRNMGSAKAMQQPSVAELNRWFE